MQIIIILICTIDNYGLPISKADGDDDTSMQRSTNNAIQDDSASIPSINENNGDKDDVQTSTDSGDSLEVAEQRRIRFRFFGFFRGFRRLRNDEDLEFPALF